MNTQEPWEVNLPESMKTFIHEILEQIPEAGGARFAFVSTLNKIAAPSKEVQQRLDKLTALEGSGVDNWEWYDDAIATLVDDEEDEDDN